MNLKKTLKIIGIIVGGIIVLVIFLTVTRISLNSKNSSRIYTQYQSDGWGMSNAPEVGSLGGSRMFSGQDSYEAAPMAMESSGSAKVAAPSSTADELPPIDKKIIRTGNLNLQVEKVDDAMNNIAQIAQVNGGDIFSSNIQQSKSKIKSGNVTVKVPVANFNQTFNELKKLATLVINETTSGQDVTEQYSDLQAQLRNKQAEEQTFVKILERTGSIKEVLDVTREISRVRGEIERLQGRLRFMDSQTDMSTITIRLTEDMTITAVETWRPVQVIKTAFNNLVKNLQGFIEGLINFIITALPMLLLWAAIIWILYKVGKKIYAKIFKKNNNINQQ